ncbi:MAG: DsbA family protein [Alphaproteobacteria bacterium]|nr:MAG: DsbA family protein [Alphaproteobacteria bacterium]
MTFSIKILTVTLGVILGLGLSVPKSFAFNDDEQSEIEAIVHNYLIENPQILEEMIAAMKFQEAFSAQKKAKDIIVEKYDAIFYPGAAFVTGNPKGDVTLVEFFDYTCVFCRKSLPDLEKLINTDPNLRVVFIDFPALRGRNPTSMVATRASVAAAQQEGKYAAYHFKMMGTKSGLTEKAIVRIAGEVGLDVEQLTKDMNAPETYARIDANMELARDLGIDGTPTFIVGDQVIAGAVGYDLLKAEIDEVRRKAAAAKTKAD